jgi:phosphohistidine phosphatase SixA
MAPPGHGTVCGSGAFADSAPTPGRLDVSRKGYGGYMRYVELRRHTDNDGDRLTSQGVSEAERIGRDALHPPYAAFVSTGARRATQMVEILRHAAGQDDVAITQATGMRSAVEDRWRAAAKAAGTGADLAAMRGVDPDLVDRDSRVLGSSLREIVDALPEGGRALVVGHTPTNEAAVLGLTGRVVPPLSKGEGILLVKDGEAYRVERLG